MKLLGISQRVEIIPSYGERRDCLDQRWFALANALGFSPVPLPNIAADQVAEYLNAINISAILLSGGNSLSFLEPEASDAAPERDEFELALIEYALHKDIPVVGVCRGMQIITYYCEGKLEKIPAHIATRHEIAFTGSLKDEVIREVNSFHQWGVKEDGLGELLMPVARNVDDGLLEAVQHKSARLMGVMWHPEREQPFNVMDIKLIKRFLS